MIVTTYICDCCGAQSSNRLSFGQTMLIDAATNVSSTALVCTTCSKAASDAFQAELLARKGTQTGVVLA